MKISIIIPVYNVIEWLDECLESIIRQTLEDFEVILVNDGSTDGSYERCLHWSESDSRIRVITQNNSGPSIARNRGIMEAKGEYLAFIDADDWIDRDFLKKLYDAAYKYNADMVECDFYRVDNRTGEKSCRICSGSLGMIYNFEEHMIYGNLSIWKCLIRRTLFENYNVEFPNCHSEAKAVYPFLLALSNKIINIQEPLYYYRRFRENSLTQKPRKNNGDENAIGLNAFNALIDNFKRIGIYEKYYNILEELIKNKLSDILAGCFYRKEKKEYLKLVENYKEYIKKQFPDSKDFEYITFGGYNLNRIVWNMNVLHDAYCRFNFSSLISVMSPIGSEMELRHKNRYRELMLSRDISGALWEVMNKVKPKYLILDLLEERYDIVCYKNSYLTKSDAFDTAENKCDYTILKRDSQECFELWKTSCFAFISKIAKDYNETKIVLIKNFLCEEYGDIKHVHKYSDISKIKKINKMLESYYNFFQDNCPDVMVIEAMECKPYITDVEYEYGVEPSHLNEFANRKIAKKIEQQLFANLKE